MEEHEDDFFIQIVFMCLFSSVYWVYAPTSPHRSGEDAEFQRRFRQELATLFEDGVDVTKMTSKMVYL